MVAWLLSMIFAFLVFIWAYFLQPNDIFGFFVICLFSGMAVGANLALPSAIIAEFINSNKHEKYAASYYSISNFLSKFSLAFASGIALPFLGFMNYQPGVARNDYLFPTIYALLPCFILLIAIIILNRLINAKTI
jgi:Na+/melibiose symporter-like transporter